MVVVDVKHQIQEEVSRILMSISDDDAKDAIDKFFEDNGIKVITDDEAVAGLSGDPLDEGVITWCGASTEDENGEDVELETSIELNPDEIEDGKKYYFTWRGNKMYVQKKSFGKDKFEIGIFQDETE